MTDSRARQFWDPNHRVSDLLKASGVKPECCDDDGVLWDMAAVYAPGARWNDRPPTPLYAGGTLVKTAPELESHMLK